MRPALLPNVTPRVFRAILLCSAVVSLAPFAKATGQQGDSGGRASRAHSALVEDKELVKVRAGDDVKSLLQAKGIVPDAQAIGRFYKLNPQVSNANALKVGSSVFLPVIRNQDSAISDDDANHWVIRADTTYKKMMGDRAELLLRLARQLANRPGATVGDKKLSAISVGIASQARTIARSSIPLDSSTLTRIEADLSASEEQLSNALGNGTNIDSAIATAELVTSALKPHARASREGLNHAATVGFSVIDSSGNERANVMIVCALPMEPANSGKQQRIPKLLGDSNPVTATLDLGPWIVWVEDLKDSVISTSRRTIEVSVNTSSRPIPLIVK